MAKLEVLHSRGALSPKITASGDGLFQRRLEMIAQMRMRARSPSPSATALRRRAEAGDAGEILRAGAQAAFC